MKIINSGAAGHMGRILTGCIEKAEGFELAAGVDSFAAEGDGIYKSFSDDIPQADVLIDFSFHGCIADILEFAVKRNLPAVIATTGHTDEEKALIKEASAKIPVFYSGNMSVGIALLVSLAKQTAKAFPGADIEIVEIHHNRKADAPSGTAKMIAEAVKEIRPEAELVYGRRGMSKRSSGEIGMHSLRMGNIVGIHEVIVSTETQTISLKHEAHDRALFADGALEAAKFLAGKPAGLYDMNDLVTP